MRAAQTSWLMPVWNVESGTIPVLWSFLQAARWCFVGFRAINAGVGENT